MSHSTPKATLQALLASYDLGPNSLVVIDQGTYAGGTVTITAADEGATYVGAPGGSEFTYSGTRFDLRDADHNLFYGLGFSGSGGTGLYLHSSGILTSMDNTVQDCVFTGLSTAIRVEQGDANEVVGCTISGSGSYGLYLLGGETTVRGNTISGQTAGLYAGAVSGYGNINLVVEDNTFSGNATAINLGQYVAAAEVRGNSISGSSSYGVYSDTASLVIIGNTVFGNAKGIASPGLIGGASWTDGQPNDVYSNTVGIEAKAGAVVQYNRIHGNTTGILAGNSTSLHHNLIYRNTSQGILVGGVHDISIESNTVYAPSGDAVRLQNSAYNVTLRHNILWTENGYDIYVATDSQQAFTSDYNNLYASGTGKLVWFQKAFTDLFDWQVEADFDSHSIGCTVPAPLLDDPRFFNLAADDYHLLPASTSIDAGSPGADCSQEPSPNGGRIDLGAYGNTPLARQSRPAYVELDYPNYYADWEATVGHAILWHTWNVSGDLDIDLYEEGVGKIADIAVVAATEGSYGWIPADTGIIPQPMGRPRQRPRRLSGDKGYSVLRVRDWLKAHGITPVIPHKDNERARYDDPAALPTAPDTGAAAAAARDTARHYRPEPPWSAARAASCGKRRRRRRDRE